MRRCCGNCGTPASSAIATSTCLPARPSSRRGRCSSRPGSSRGCDDWPVRVGLLHPGEMGAAIGALLVEAGHDVLWCPQGRSEATAERADAAGLTGVEDLGDTEVILSVCPPHAALEVARSLQGASALGV